MTWTREERLQNFPKVRLSKDLYSWNCFQGKSNYSEMSQSTLVTASQSCMAYDMIACITLCLQDGKSCMQFVHAYNTIACPQQYCG